MVFSQLVPDKEEVARIVAGCDVCLTIYRAAKEHTWSPNKMFDALAAGKPVLINVPGWLGETIEKNHCGRYVDPHRPEALADALEELSQRPRPVPADGRKRPRLWPSGSSTGASWPPSSKQVLAECGGRHAQVNDAARDRAERSPFTPGP